MTNHDVTGSGRHQLDIWTVRLASGETRTLSLDELDEAFNAGWVDAKTPVLEAGAIHWSTLGQVAGLDTTPPPTSVVPNSIAPLALDAPYDLGPDDSDMRAIRPRRGKKIFGALVALAVVSGLGVAAFRARPTLERAYASAVHRAPVTHVDPAAPTPEAPPPLVAAPSPPPPPAPSPEATPAIPTMSAASLPNAAPAPAKAKKPAPKRRK